MKTLDLLMSKFTPELQAEINARAAEMRLETQLYKLRERLELTQQQQANAMNIAQSSVVAIEKRGAEVKLMATYKKWHCCKYKNGWVSFR